MNLEAAPATPEKATITLRLRLPFLSLLILFLLAVVLPDRVWNTLLIGLGGMFAVAYMWVWYLARGLHASRQIHTRWVGVGDALVESFDCWNNSPIPALWVEVIDESNVPGYQAAVVRSPGIDRLDHWGQTAVCQQRGQYRIGPWSIRTGDPFGIFIVTRHYPETSEIIIYPPSHAQLPINLPTGESHGRKRARQRSLQATINAASTRPYYPGDPQRLIHWRTTARRGELFVREFDLDVMGDIWLVLDMQADVQLGKGLAGTEEQAVLIAAALAARALRQNRAVGLAGYGRLPQIISPGQGQGQQWRILRALALIRADGGTDLATALRDVGRTAERGSTAVIITANPTIGWLPQLLRLTEQGMESHVILQDRASFGDTDLEQSFQATRLLQTAVHQLGVACTIIRQGEVTVPPPVKQPTFRVTPLGRVVEVKGE